jgi:hypothetical protein
MIRTIFLLSIVSILGCNKICNEANVELPEHINNFSFVSSGSLDAHSKYIEIKVDDTVYIFDLSGANFSLMEYEDLDTKERVIVLESE